MSRAPLLLVVGEAPVHGYAPLTSDSGLRLAKAMGLPFDVFRAMTIRVNICGSPDERWPGKRLGRVRLWQWFRSWRLPALLLGRKVQALALARPKTDALWQELLRSGDCWQYVAGCPHPSGRSRWWNDEENRQKFREWSQALLTMRLHGRPVTQAVDWRTDQ